MNSAIDWPDLALMFGLSFQLDSNRVNARGGLASVSELEEWKKRGVIGLEWSSPVYEELARDAPDGARWKKACGRLVAKPAITLESERRDLAEIEALVFPGGPRDENERADALALFAAKKYCAIFVTNDGAGGKKRGILTSRQRLADVGVQVVTDEEAVALVRRALGDFARMERQRSMSGESLHEWIAAWESLRATTANKRLEPPRPRSRSKHGSRSVAARAAQRQDVGR